MKRSRRPRPSPHDGEEVAHQEPLTSAEVAALRQSCRGSRSPFAKAVVRLADSLTTVMGQVAEVERRRQEVDEERGQLVDEADEAARAVDHATNIVRGLVGRIQERPQDGAQCPSCTPPPEPVEVVLGRALQALEAVPRCYRPEERQDGRAMMAFEPVWRRRR